MAAINFPASPSLNDIHTHNGKSWIWNGVHWSINDTSNLQKFWHTLGSTNYGSTSSPQYDYKYYRITNDITYDHNRVYEIIIDADDNYGMVAVYHLYLSSHSNTGNHDRIIMSHVSGRPTMMRVVLDSNEHVWIAATNKWGAIRIRGIHENEDVTSMPFADSQLSSISSPQFNETAQFIWDGDTNTLALMPTTNLTGNFGIGTATPDSELDVVGVIRAGNNTSTGGGTALRVQYQSLGDHTANFGAERSSGAPLLGYCVESSQTDNNTFVSTADNSHFHRGALVVSNELEFWSALGDVNNIPTVGDPVTMTKNLSLDSSGNLSITGDINLDTTNQKITFGQTTNNKAYIENIGGQIRIGSDNLIEIYETDTNALSMYLTANDKSINFQNWNYNGTSKWSNTSGVTRTLRFGEFSANTAGYFGPDANTNSDELIDLGASDGRFRDAHFSGTINTARISIEKTDNDISDHIMFYNGTVRVGEIGCHDDTWLRINSSTAKNIYTPRMFRADGGFQVDNKWVVSSDGNTLYENSVALSNKYALKDHIRSLGVISTFPSNTSDTENNNNLIITTSGFISDLETMGVFDSSTSVGKLKWSYSEMPNLTDAGRFQETAGTSFITWTDNSDDTTRGNITGLFICPTTSDSAGKVFIYNDQGVNYAPGWREVWTNTSDGSGSGLDADLLDGQQGSYYLDYNNFINTPSTSQWTTSGSNIYYNTGNVGIGTTTPSSNLSVVDTTFPINGTLFELKATATGTNGTGAYNGIIQKIYADGIYTAEANNDNFYGLHLDISQLSGVQDKYAATFVGGNVGIGTEIPIGALDIETTNTTPLRIISKNNTVNTSTTIVYYNKSEAQDSSENLRFQIGNVGTSADYSRRHHCDILFTPDGTNGGQVSFLTGGKSGTKLQLEALRLDSYQNAFFSGFVTASDGIKVSNLGDQTGTIRYNSTTDDFEGRKSSKWTSMTQGHTEVIDVTPSDMNTGTDKNILKVSGTYQIDGSHDTTTSSGTFTPSYTTSGIGFSNMTFNPARYGTYSRVGRLIYFTLYIYSYNYTAGSETGYVKITGLPFTSATSHTVARGQVTIGYHREWKYAPTSGYVMEGTNQIRLFKRN